MAPSRARKVGFDGAPGLREIVETRNIHFLGDVVPYQKERKYRRYNPYDKAARIRDIVARQELGARLERRITS